ncbi:hypothetical protein NQZ68_032323 [Dissostichus eleginoides]|nr:hypothetical protein NQZ68_032323 [Dissostichus eleginoides]
MEQLGFSLVKFSHRLKKEINKSHRQPVLCCGGRSERPDDMEIEEINEVAPLSSD